MTTNNTSPKWQYRVYKIQRGGNGKYFRYPTAATFNAEPDARAYAREFATEQRGVVGTKIVLASRKGDQTIQEIDTRTGRIDEF